MKPNDERWAIFWCELLHPVLFEEVDAGQTNALLKELAQKEVLFPNGKIGRPCVATLRRKLNRYRQGRFEALGRKPRADRGRPRALPAEMLAYAIELKREQPYRSHEVINAFLKERFGVMAPRSSLYRHLREAGATRLKLGIVRKKVRRRWTRDETHELWVGDFEEGPYILHGQEALPTHLCAFIDAHSRYVVEARYYLRQSLDILIDSLLRAFATHGAPRELYLDNAKVYHSHGLKGACYRLHINLLHRPAHDPAPGGLIERFFGTAQTQFEAEVRAGETLTLEKLNRLFSAWLEMAYHQRVHSETNQSPKDRYAQGLTVIRHVDMNAVLAAFMRRECRTVHRDFADVRLDGQFYRVDPKFRGDKLEVRYDPFGRAETVELYSLQGVYLGQGALYHRDVPGAAPPIPEPGKPKYSYLDLVHRQHEEQLAAQTRGIDYRKIAQQRAWPFTGLLQTVAGLLGRQGGCAAFTARELEALKKAYNQHADLGPETLQQAAAQAPHKTVAYILYELQRLHNPKEKN
jgi:putative transposase